jgi:hypothetical protein
MIVAKTDYCYIMFLTVLSAALSLQNEELKEAIVVQQLLPTNLMKRCRKEADI